jgi:integrase
LAQDLDIARDFVRRSRADGTRDIYRRLWRSFARWCEARSVVSLPAAPAVVAAFLAAEAQRGRAVASLGVARAAIRAAHEAANHPSPTASGEVVRTLGGISRVRGRRPRRKRALMAGGALRTVVDAIPDDLCGIRDRAVLLLGFAGALRRSEVAQLFCSDLTWADRGLLLTLRRSKTDQEGRGQTIAVVRGRELCPVQAVATWLRCSGIVDGPVFRRIGKARTIGAAALSGHAIARIVKARVAAAGLDPAEYSGHSLRSGFITSAARNGASIWKLAEISRHRSMDVLRGYIRDTELFGDHAGRDLL